LINRTKKKLMEGKAVVGTIVSLDNEATAGVMSKAGFDFILIDTQHTPIGPDSLSSIIMRLQPTESDIVVRVVYNEPWYINMAYDVGADGVIVPMTNNPDDVRRAVSASKYPPDGVRSWGPKNTAKYDAPPGYWARANDELMVWPQIETVEAVENVDEILQVDGVDGIMIGPTDLTLSLGLPRSYPPELPEAEERINYVLSKCKEYKVPFGHFTSTYEIAEKWLRRGGQIVTVGSDLGFMADGANGMSAAATKLLSEL